ncbi:MAG: hypothetical protein R2867_30610 [Caldilineaceae bacterium]
MSVTSVAVTSAIRVNRAFFRHDPAHRIKLSKWFPLRRRLLVALTLLAVAAAPTASINALVKCTVVDTPDFCACRIPGIGCGCSRAQARLEVTPYSNIFGSTYNDNSFRLTNNSTGGQTITGLTLDLRSALLPDLVFDPDSEAGDQFAKPFTANDGELAVGYVSSQLAGFHNALNDNDGFDLLTVTFDDFDQNEIFGFSIDIDPTSDQRADLGWSAGSGQCLRSRIDRRDGDPHL